MRFARITLVLALVVSARSFAGPLDPPVGPVAPSFKTLTDTEPRTAINAANTPGNASCIFHITQPGSYYLTGNLTGVSGKGGILIESSDVTIDLMGFEVIGVAGTTNGVGVPSLSTSYSNVVVRSGTVRSWGGYGVGFNGSNCAAYDIRAMDNTGSGIALDNNNIASRCMTRNCSIGIVAGTNCVVDSSTVSSSTGDGIFVTVGCTISNCACSSNAGNGIRATFDTLITNCTSNSNTADGIRASARCTIQNNLCNLNSTGSTGAGIHTTGGDNRIEGNNCVSNGRGILCDGSGSFIVRNTCSGNNTNWILAANNVFGPIIDRTAPASAAVNGNAAASSLGSTEANANFSY